ncbi:MAG: hypothetical protein ACM3O8_15750 [Methylococcaceae bacterium]
MKRFLYLIAIVIFYSFSIDIPKHRLIEARHCSDNSKDCRKIGDCIAKKYLLHDTLNLIIFTDNDCEDLNVYRDTFSFYNDTLNINSVDTNRVIRGSENVYFISEISHSPCIGGYDTQRSSYKLTGFKTMPKSFQLNGSNVCDCPTQPIKFELYKNDTINLMDANGKKHGVWLRFFDSGSIQEKKYYDHGNFVDGKTYDSNGNDLHYIGEFEDGTAIMRIDTLGNK